MKNSISTDSGDRFASLLRYLNEWLKPSRFAHSLSVARVSEELCARFGVDPEKGKFAGLAHDLMKDRPLETQYEYARRAGRYRALENVASAVDAVSHEPTFADKIIHGPAAAVFLFETYGLKDYEVLEAVALHSQAGIGMSDLAKIVFVADKLEPARKGVPDQAVEWIATEGLDTLLMRAVRTSIEWLKANNLAIAQSTTNLYNSLTTGASS